jgi:hypothetical protein
MEYMPAMKQMAYQASSNAHDLRIVVLTRLRRHLLPMIDVSYAMGLLIEESIRERAGNPDIRRARAMVGVCSMPGSAGSQPVSHRGQAMTGTSRCRCRAWASSGG